MVLDRCTDGTEGIVSEFAKTYDNVKMVVKNITKYPRTIFKGYRVAEAFNWGLRETEEEPDYILTVSADIVLTPNYVEEALKIFRRNDRCAIVGKPKWEGEVITEEGTIRGAGSIYRYDVLKRLTGGLFVECEAEDSYIQFGVQASNYEIEKLENADIKLLRPTTGISIKGQMLAAYRWGFSSYKLGYTPLYTVGRAKNKIRNPLQSLVLLISYFFAMLSRQKRQDFAGWVRIYQKKDQRDRYEVLRAVTQILIYFVRVIHLNDVLLQVTIKNAPKYLKAMRRHIFFSISLMRATNLGAYPIRTPKSLGSNGVIYVDVVSTIFNPTLRRILVIRQNGNSR